MAHGSPFFCGFVEELQKLALEVPPVPVQRIPGGPSPAPAGPPRPALPMAPAYKPPSPPAQATPKQKAAPKPVSSAWLQMADRGPTESTSRFVSRQYGVPERQMGVNKGKVMPDARDPTPPGRINNARASFVRAPTMKDTSKLNVPAYLQGAVGGIDHAPSPYILRNGQARPYRFQMGTAGQLAPQPVQSGVR